MRRVRQLLIGVAVATIALGVPSVANAHIDPDPTEAPAGSTLSVGFTVEHGCDGSPTVQLDMRLPDGVTAPAPEPPPGWTGSVTDNIVTFTGGPLPDDEPGTFRITMTLPAAADTTIYFPFVQRCEVGEIRWIDVPNNSGESVDEPAPAMALAAPVAPPPTAPATLAPTTNPPVTTSSTTVAATTTAPATSTSTSSGAASPTAVVSTTSLRPSTTAAVTVARADTTTGTILFVVVVAVLAALGGLLIRQARRRT